MAASSPVGVDVPPVLPSEPAPSDVVIAVLGEEDDHRHQGEDDGPSAVRDDDELVQVDHGVYQGQPLHLDGDEVEEEDLVLRIEQGEGEKHGLVDIGGTGVAGDGGGDVAADHAQQVVTVEVEGAPLVLQRAAYHVIEVEAQDEVDKAVAPGNEDEGHAGEARCRNGIG